jgi:hypothetical protein
MTRKFKIEARDSMRAKTLFTTANSHTEALAYFELVASARGYVLLGDVELGAGSMNTIPCPPPSVVLPAEFTRTLRARRELLCSR